MARLEKMIGFAMGTTLQFAKSDGRLLRNLVDSKLKTGAKSWQYREIDTPTRASRASALTMPKSRAVYRFAPNVENTHCPIALVFHAKPTANARSMLLQAP